MDVDAIFEQFHRWHSFTEEQRSECRELFRDWLNDDTSLLIRFPRDCAALAAAKMILERMEG